MHEQACVDQRFLSTQQLHSWKRRSLQFNLSKVCVSQTLRSRILHKIFEKYGEIISLKICFNGDHSSKGFGYVTFEEEKAALAAIEAGAHLEADKVVAVPYK